MAAKRSACSGGSPGERDGLNTVEQKLGDVAVKRIEDVEKSRGVGKGEIQGVGIEDFDVIAGMSGRLPLDEVLACDGNQRGIEFHANHAAKRKVGGEHESAALAATDVDEDVIATGIRAVGEGLVPESEDLEKCRWGGSPVGGDVAVVGTAGAGAPSAAAPAGVPPTPERD